MKAEEAIAVHSDLTSLNRQISNLQYEMKALKDMRETPSEHNAIKAAHDFSYGSRKKPKYKARVDAVLDEMRHDIIRAAELGIERELRILKNRRRVLKMAFDNYFDGE